MSDAYTGEELQAALDGCAAEPVHIPGIVQDFACLIAVNMDTGAITHASANTDRFIGTAHVDLLGRDARDTLGGEIWHSLQNAMAQIEGPDVSVHAGNFTLGDGLGSIRAMQGPDGLILEFEHVPGKPFSGADAFQTLTYLQGKIEGCTSREELFDRTTAMMRSLAGYDRVMIYRFDPEFNGEVVAEDCSRTMPSFVGLRFPNWDIPAQALEMMRKVPVRLIMDIEAAPVDLVAADSNAPPLDISLAASRGVSPIHLEYLRNMGVAGSMTLNIKIEDRLWGMISFHHRRARVPLAGLRAVLASFAQTFSQRLLVLEQSARLDLVARVDAMKDQILRQQGTRDGFREFAASVFDLLDVQGMFVRIGDDVLTAGQCPDASVQEALRDYGQAHDGVQSFESLIRSHPSLANGLNSCAGALVFAPDPDRTLILFREERVQELRWAGNPEKTIEQDAGRARLSPRGSFSTYLEQVVGTCKPWSDQDIYFASRIWTLINTVERRELITSLNRQQKIMIDELNHRVRNILALIRSVSRQARTSSYGSMASYSRTLEARIEALAASHELASGSLVDAVPLRDLIEREFEPYRSKDSARVQISGPAPAMRAELAPIFSLVIHELVTNAVKYGALSNDTGSVSVTVAKLDDGYSVNWQEQGGPPVIAPEEIGFGSTLIQNAIPHEMNGRAALTFGRSGVGATFHLPAALFETGGQREPSHEERVLPVVFEEERLDAILGEALCLVIEDNFVIAQDMADQIKAFGVPEVDIAANVDAAMEILDTERPTFAVVDMNLGGGKTSFPVAERMDREGVPFFFLTGYGDREGLPESMHGKPWLTKPATAKDLMSAIAEILLKD